MDDNSVTPPLSPSNPYAVMEYDSMDIDMILQQEEEEMAYQPCHEGI